MEAIEGVEGRVQRLVVFDYDWSLIDCNSDEAVLDLHPPLHQEMHRLRREGMQWTQLVDRMLTMLADMGVTRSEILSHVAAVPVQEGMLEAVRLAHSLPNTRLAVVSDANHAFISAMLQKHCLEAVFSDVFTNEARWEAHAVPGTTTRGERLRVSAYHKGPPHDCPLCPVNMCKGSIMQQLIAKYRPEQVVYIGDGGGDFCPCAGLTAADVIFARASAEEAAGSRSFALLEKLAQLAEEDKLAAQLCPWRTGHDVYEGFREVFLLNH
jgi:pyridoxal phosphate phosphatase PHOSPHO2